MIPVTVVVPVEINRGRRFRSCPRINSKINKEPVPELFWFKEAEKTTKTK